MLKLIFEFMNYNTNSIWLNFKVVGYGTICKDIFLHKVCSACLRTEMFRNLLFLKLSGSLMRVKGFFRKYENKCPQWLIHCLKQWSSRSGSDTRSTKKPPWYTEVGLNNHNRKMEEVQMDNKSLAHEMELHISYRIHSKVIKTFWLFRKSELKRNQNLFLREGLLLSLSGEYVLIFFYPLIRKDGKNGF